MLRVVYLDDADKYSENIDTWINKTKISSFRKFSTKFSIMNYIQDTIRGLVDIAFIKYEFSECSGIDIAKEILSLYPHILIVFITNDFSTCRSIFTDIYPYSPFDIILSPLNYNEFYGTIQRAIDYVANNNENSLCVKTLAGYAKIKCRNISYIENNKRIIIIHLRNGMEYTLYGKLDDILPQLPVNFLKIHQSYVINIEDFIEFTNSTITLRPNVVLPISRGNKIIIKEKIFEMNGKC